MRDRPSDTHRQIAQRRTGRKLGPDDVVDHRNTDKTDNTDANLRVMSRDEHSRRHADPAVKTTAKLTKALTMPRRGEKLYG